MTGSMPAGWFPDPTGRLEHRYWDGNAWTEHVSAGGVPSTDPIVGDYAAPASVPAPATTSGRSPGAVVLLAGGALLVVGALLPWAKASAGLISVSKAGTDGDGVLTLILGGALALVSFLAWDPKPDRFAVVTGALLGLIAGVIAFYDISNVRDAISTAESRSSLVHPSVGEGLWITAVGAAVAMLGALLKGNDGKPQTG